jgi:hypothetical protein
MGQALGWGLGGMMMGLGQWLMLRRRVRRTGWWILATALAWPAAIWASWGLEGLVGNWGGWYPGWAVIGAVVGLAQWLVLLRRVRWSGLWVLATAIGSYLGSWVTALLPSGTADVWSLDNPFLAPAGAVYGAILGGATAAVLILLFFRAGREAPG